MISIIGTQILQFFINDDYQHSESEEVLNKYQALKDNIKFVTRFEKEDSIENIVL